MHADYRGRPGKSPEDQRKNTIAITLTDVEMATLRGEARRLGLPMSAVVRMALLAQFAKHETP